mmetsp:Transcript_20942/g.59194  ORF Transcript_20942/g.59194 Transcript_20942/m.59194 type:complete len:267 (-) Transcript_20942:523-1323(-)
MLIMVDKHQLPWPLVVLHVEIVNEVLDPGLHHSAARDHSHASNLWDGAAPVGVPELIAGEDRRLCAAPAAGGGALPGRHTGPVQVAGAPALRGAPQSTSRSRLLRLVLLGEVCACSVAPPAGVAAELAGELAGLVGEGLLPDVVLLFKLVEAFVEFRHLAGTGGIASGCGGGSVPMGGCVADVGDLEELRALRAAPPLRVRAHLTAHVHNLIQQRLGALRRRWVQAAVVLKQAGEPRLVLRLDVDEALRPFREVAGCSLLQTSVGR